MKDYNKLIYTKTLRSALDDGTVKAEDSILVVCGGSYDKEVLHRLGFKNVTISNLDSRMTGNEFDPYLWSYQDAETITEKTDSYDWVLVHAGLHHCYAPHKALLEMIRVGRKGAIVFEGRESWIMNVANKLGLAPVYEIEAVIGNDLKYGGVSNSHIPNFIYRWEEREVIKIVSSYYPQFKDNAVKFYYNLRLPDERVEFIKSPLKRFIMNLSFLPLRFLIFLFPKQSNEFGFIIKKGKVLQDWLVHKGDDLALNMPFLEENFDVTVRK